MRNQGRLRLGYFPLPIGEARRIRACLRYPTSPVSTIDPCIGDGAAFLALTAETCARRYGIELDAYRAEQAASVVDELIHGDCLDVHCPVESFGLAFLNPPYDWTIGEGRNERLERVFLAHAYRWLKGGGVLVLTLTVPGAITGVSQVQVHLPQGLPPNSPALLVPTDSGTVLRERGILIWVKP